MTDLHAILVRLEAIEKANSIGRIWDFALKALVPIVLALGATHISHAVRLATLEDSKFTKADATALELRLVAIITPAAVRDDLVAEIRLALRTLQAGLEKQSDRIREIETKLK